VEQIPAALLAHGPLGLLCLLLLGAVRHLYKQKESADDRHRTEMNALMDRHIAKAEAWAEKGTELAQNLNRVLDSITRPPPR
jgi:hypothetical protein